jgi:hypothetical protein
MDLNAFAKPSPLYDTIDSLALQFEIERNVARFSATMSQRGGSLVRTSLILMFDRELKILGENVLETTSTNLEITFLGARLSLYAFSILGETTATATNYIDLQLKSIWYLGLETAVRLAHIFSTISNSTPEGHGSLLHQFPKHNFWILLSSGFYLLKFLAVNTQATAAEAELARNSVRLVYSTLLSWSANSMDEYARITRIISLLANAEVAGTLAGFTRVIKRPPLSIVADVMEMAGWLRARRKENDAPPVENNPQVQVKEPELSGGQDLIQPTVEVDSMLFDESILDDWLTQEIEMGNLLYPYTVDDYNFGVTGQ